MEIKITTKQLLKVLYVIAWVIFIGLCIEAGAIIFSTFFTLTLNPADVHKLWREVDLLSLYQYDAGHFFVQALFISIVVIMKALLFYLIVKILHDKKLDMSQPFNETVGRFISNASYLALGVGLFSWRGTEYAEWLISKGAKMPEITDLHLGGADVWIFMGITLFVIAQIFKRGIEIQDEHELTV